MEGFQISAKNTKLHQIIANYRVKWARKRSLWLISLSFGKPFVKIERYRPKVYIFDMNNLKIQESEPIKFDVISDEDDKTYFENEQMRRYRINMRYDASLAYTLNDSSVVKDIS